MNDIIVIKCPICGREYLPVEIYLPNAFFGKPDIVKKDAEGRIIGTVGEANDFVEHYVCDTCNKPFKVTAMIEFKTEHDIENDFTEEYTSRQTVQYTLDEF